MANEEHLKILKQGVKAWNRWREENLNTRPDLSGAHLGGADLHEADLSEANLIKANLGGANLHEADLSEANLSEANLSRTDLSFAHLGAANLHRADLSGAALTGTVLSGADLSSADLHGADLMGAGLSRADLNGADLREATVGYTVFADLDLSAVKGLDTVEHYAPSYIDIHTIHRSHGQIPEAFLRGAGVPDTFIAYMGSLTGKAFEYYSCFIAYSSKDKAFAQRLHADLQAKGVRCWFAPEDMKTGDEIRPRIDQAIQTYDKLLVVLSKNSTANWRVKKEVETAFEQETKRNKTVLFPVRLDTVVMKTDQAWAGDIRRTRHIGDFSHWKDHDSYQRAFNHLLRDLKAEEG